MAGADPNLNPLNPNLVPLPDEAGDVEQDLEQLRATAAAEQLLGPDKPGHQGDPAVVVPPVVPLVQPDGQPGPPGQPQVPGMDPAQQALAAVATGLQSLTVAQQRANVGASVAQLKAMITPYDGSQPCQFTSWIAQIMKTAPLYQQTADQELKRIAYLSSAGFCSKVIWRHLKNGRTLKEMAVITGVPYRPSSWEELLENSVGEGTDQITALNTLKLSRQAPGQPIWMYEQALRDLGAKAYRHQGGVEVNDAAMLSTSWTE